MRVKEKKKNNAIFLSAKFRFHHRMHGCCQIQIRSQSLMIMMCCLSMNFPTMQLNILLIIWCPKPIVMQCVLSWSDYCFRCFVLPTCMRGMCPITEAPLCRKQQFTSITCILVCRTALHCGGASSRWQYITQAKILISSLGYYLLVFHCLTVQQELTGRFQTRKHIYKYFMVFM